MRMTKTNLFMLIFLISISVFGVDGTPYWNRQRPSSSATLYSFDDPIAQLRRNNFTSTLIGSPRAWIVEFYASWCGHCQRFASTWRELAYDIQKWKKVVRIAAIACSDDVNLQACSNYGIRGYPTVKAFPNNADYSTSGLTFTREKNLEALRHFVISFVSSLPGQDDWPELRAKDVSLESYMASLSDSLFKHELAVLEPNSRDVKDTSALYVGREVILDWSNKKNINFVRIKYSQANSEFYTNSSLPMIYCLHKKKDKSRHYKLIDSSGARDAANEAIDKHVYRRTETTPLAMETTTSQRQITSQVPNFTETQVPPFDAKNISNMGVALHDLESSLNKTFYSEIPLQQLHFGPRMNALLDYLRVLSKFYPGELESKRYVENIYYWLKNKNETGFRIDSNDLRTKFQSFQNYEAFLSNHTTWTGCRGSQARFRGYPCSLWMTFHALTVRAYSQGNDADFNPQTLLLVIREYIHNFFTCRHCARHFVERAANITGEVDPAIKDSAVMWLWNVHNEVNKRLAGDDTEDPYHPKVQFPPKELCEDCRISVNETTGEIKWNKTAVLKFLIEYYAVDEIREPAPVAAPLVGESKMKECNPRPTNWSICSRTCDTGFSYRMNLNKSSGAMELETRLCNIIPCRIPSSYNGDGSCDINISPTEIIKLDDFSIKRNTTLPWKFCQCSNGLCMPKSSHTEMVTLESQGLSANGQMEIIDTCPCQ